MWNWVNFEYFFEHDIIRVFLIFYAFYAYSKYICRISWFLESFFENPQEWKKLFRNFLNSHLPFYISYKTWPHHEMPNTIQLANKSNRSQSQTIQKFSKSHSNINLITMFSFVGLSSWDGVALKEHLIIGLEI
jgi:hypothetical protein